MVAAMPPPERTYALGSLFGPRNREVLGHVPHANRLGICVVEMGPATVTLLLPYRAEFVGDPNRGVIFGGAVTTLLDHACGMATACSLEELVVIATIDLRIDYLRAAEPGREVFGRTECYKTTRNIGFVRGLAWEHDPADPFATCHATMMIGARRQRSTLASDVGRDEEASS